MRTIALQLDGNDDHWRNRDAVVDALSTLTDVDDGVMLLETPRNDLSPAKKATVLPVRGLCSHRSGLVKKISIRNGAETTPLRCQEPRDAFAGVLREHGFRDPLCCGFSGQLTLAPNQQFSDPTLSPVIEVQLTNGQRFRQSLFPELQVNAATAHAAPGSKAGDAAVVPKWDDSAGPGIVIGMATYNPEPAAFERQLESILAQTYANWHLIINDDCSDRVVFDHLRTCAASDSRISLRRNEKNLGFYHNFEKVLELVPDSAQLVALSDQDDRWYPEKLETLLQHLQPDSSLCYCDMRIVNADGDVVSESYWRGRRNNFTDLDVLLLANTVTGAASLFRRELLDLVLPFPPRIGDAFHDHWIACAALATGRLCYVDQPLYDYVQHDEAVVGHCDFETPTLGVRVRNVGRHFTRDRRQGAFSVRLMQARQSALAVFRYECLRIELICDNLLVRCSVIDRDKQRALRLYGNGIRSSLALFIKHLSVLRRGHSTNDAEIRLGVGYLVDAFEHRARKLQRRWRNLRAFTTDKNKTFGNSM